MLPKFFITCDPGNTGTGFAVWNIDINIPIATQLFQGNPRTLNWNINRKLILLQTKSFLEYYYGVIKDLYIEKPQYMESHVGLTAARSDSLFKLITFYGGLLWQAEEIGYTIHPVSIPEWKGQLSKKQVAQRIKRDIGKTYPDHVTDSIGIGLWLLNKSMK